MEDRMNTNDRREALGYLDEAWRRAAAGDIQPAESNVIRVLDLLESTVARGGEPKIVATMVHRHVEEGRGSIIGRDLLGAMLAAMAALDILQPQFETVADSFQTAGHARVMRRSHAV